MFSPDVQHQGTTKRHFPGWIIHQPRMLFFFSDGLQLQKAQPVPAIRNRLSDIMALTYVSTRSLHQGQGLFSQTKILNQGAVLLQILFLQIIEETATLPNHLQQPLSGMMILGMHLEMLGQILDPIGEQGDLHHGRTGV
jgi:hypothetical protein